MVPLSYNSSVLRLHLCFKSKYENFFNCLVISLKVEQGKALRLIKGYCKCTFYCQTNASVINIWNAELIIIVPFVSL